MKWIQGGLKLKIHNVLTKKSRQTWSYCGSVNMSRSPLTSLLLDENNVLALEEVDLMLKSRKYCCLLWELCKYKMTLQMSPGLVFYASVKINCFSQDFLTGGHLLPNKTSSFLKINLAVGQNSLCLKDWDWKNKHPPAGTGSWHYDTEKGKY